MKFIDMTQAGDASVLQIAEGTMPVCGAEDILIRVHAFGMNRPDILQRQGLYPPPPNASPILGLEVAGEIIECGAKTNGFEIGDKVCALTNGGGYAEYVAVPFGQALKIPEGMDMVTAAGIPETFFTVWNNLFMPRAIPAPHDRRGQKILIHGGSGGIGSTAIQICKFYGAHVITTCSSKEKEKFCRALGADIVLNYKNENWQNQIEPNSLDVILDMVGAPYFSFHLDRLAHDGELVIIATQGGHKIESSLRPILQKRLTLTGSTLRPQSASAKAAIAASLHHHIGPALAQGQIAPHIDSVFPAKDIAKAHEKMEKGDHCGKIIATWL